LTKQYERCGQGRRKIAASFGLRRMNCRRKGTDSEKEKTEAARRKGARLAA